MELSVLFITVEEKSPPSVVDAFSGPGKYEQALQCVPSSLLDVDV